MDIIFTCTKCGQELEIDASGAGLEVNCPKCNVALLVPHASSAAPGQLKDTIRLSPFPTPPAPASPPPAAQRPARSAPPVVSSSAAHYSLSRTASAPSVPSTPPGTQRTPAHLQTVRAVITDFDMPLPEMMKHALKWMVAALPAFVILFLLAAVIFKLLGVIVRP